MAQFRFHHVGVVTENVDDLIAFYSGLGYSASVFYDDPIQNARLVLLEHVEGPIIELIEPKTVDSPAAGWVKRVKAGPYHTCYVVDDIKEAVKELRLKKITPVSKIVPAVAFSMRRVVFLWGTVCGLIELLEETTE
ncbi:MAG: VOC family protein [Planctomycetota bacterium]